MPTQRHLPACWRLAHRGDRLLDDLPAVAELDVVGLEQVHVVSPQPPQRFFNAGRDALGGKVEGVHVVPPALGREKHLVPPALQRRPQTLLRQRPAVVGRDVEVVDALIDGAVDCADAFGDVRLAELVAQRRGPVADDRHLHPRPAQRPVFHVCSFIRAPRPMGPGEKIRAMGGRCNEQGHLGPCVPSPTLAKIHGNGTVQEKTRCRWQTAGLR